MEKIMTVTDLVRDTCKTAAEMVKHGYNITVTSGRKVLFRIVPNQTREVKMTPQQYKALLRDLNEIASRANLDENPIIKMRKERL